LNENILEPEEKQVGRLIKKIMSSKNIMESSQFVIVVLICV